MLIQVDTDVEPIAGLLLASKLLADFAAAKNVDGAPLDLPTVHTHTHTVAPGNVMTDEGLKIGDAVPKTTLEEVKEPAEPKDPNTVAAAVFGKNATPAPVPAGTNVLPFPTLPQVNIAAPVTAPTTLPPVLSSPALPAAMLNAAVASGGQGVEVDSAGIPWDARIHQKSKGKKKTDGTWKIIKGLDPAIAQSVTAELLAAKTAAAVSAPQVTLPQPATLPVSVTTSAPAPVPGATQLPLPGQPATGAVSALEAFRNMMQKIGAGIQAETITQARVNEVHTALGLAQLQLAITQPHLIPQIEAALGL